MNNDITALAIVATIVFLILAGFLIIFIVFFQKKQIQNVIEKIEIKANYEKEILNAQNEIQEQTIKNISQELHDNIGQMLTLAKIKMNEAGSQFPENEHINSSKEFLYDALTELSALSKSLNNDNILNEGLAKSIEFELNRLERTKVIETGFLQNYKRQILDQKQEIIVFRIFQEIIQNILKHAKSKNIFVKLEDNNSIFTMTIQDDGIGFDFDKAITEKGFKSGAGLKNLLNRAQLLKGDLKIYPANHGGTVTSLSITAS